MKKGIAITFFLLFSFGLCLNGWGQEETMNTKKVVMIIPQNNFRDEELLEPKETLEGNGIKVKVASTTLLETKGMLGMVVKPDILLTEINVKDFDAVIFVGGSGASQYWDDPLAHRLAREAISENKILGAICLAPVTLAKAGILKDKKATVWPSEGGQLKAAGAIYTEKSLERDGNIITASGPAVASEFGEEVVKALR